jgi:TolB-like protein/DNA-binding winged helix-turn-helix (wHTH) protein/Tfp pilus assembly protein PilF
MIPVARQGPTSMPARPPVPSEIELDLGRYELRRGGRVKRLERLPMELLILLAERQGQLVTRSAIRERLWGAGVFVDEDPAINTAVRKVRRALRDDPDRPQFVETVVGKGYRFVGPIRIVSGPERRATGRSTALGDEPPSTPPAVTSSAGGLRQRSRWRGALVAISLAASVAVVFGLRHSRTGPGLGSVAVLPFENVGGDPDAEYLSEGLTDHLINRLTRLPHLKVIGRASVARYKGKNPDVRAVGRELGVGAVVTGRVTQQPGGFTLAVELTDARDRSQLWGAAYDRRSSELIVAHQQLAAEVAEKLRLELSPRDRALLARRDTADPEAYRLYLRGRYLSNERTEAALLRAIEYFQEAIARDSRFALAYAGLADAHSTMASAYNKRSAPRDARVHARAAALRAAEIGPELSETHVSLGQVLMQFDWEWAGAERALNRAVELDPSNGAALHARSHLFLALGQFAASARDSFRALDGDPASVMLSIHLGEHHHLSRQLDAAVAQYRKALELNPNHPNARPLLALVYEQQGLYAQAIAELERAAPFFAGTSRVRGPLGRLYGLAGRRSEARALLEELLRERAGASYVAADDVAAIHLGLGETALAFEWLERACEERAAALVNLRVEPAFDPLRGDPRFGELLRCVGLA